MIKSTMQIGSSAKSARLVWIVVLLGICMCFCTLVIVRVVLTDLHEQRGKLATIEAAADRLVDSMGQGIAESSNECNHLLTLRTTSSPSADWQGSIERAVGLFARENQSTGVAVNTGALRHMIAPMIAMRDACRNWGEAVLANQNEISERKKQTESDLTALRALLSSEEGRQRLQVAKKIRQFRATTGPSSQDLARQIIATIGPSDQMTETAVEMDNLSLFCEQLMAETDADRLADIKDNHFCGSLIRLRAAMGRTRSVSSDLQSTLDIAIARFETSVFGRGYVMDGDQHSIRPGGKGLYALCIRRLELQKQREELRSALSREAENYKSAYARFERQHAAWRDEMSVQVEQKLTTAWVLLLLMSVGGSGILLTMGLRIARSIGRQIIRIESVTADLERANAQMAAIHQTSLDGFITLDHAWNALDINRAAERTFGLRSEDATGRGLSHLIDPLTNSPADPLASLLSAGGAGMAGDSCIAVLGRRLEVRGKRSGGETFAAEMAITAAAVKGLPLYVASVRDISDQKRAEAEREELHERLLAASRQAGMAEVATGVLHNVGNILNSVNVSAGMIAEKIRASEVTSLKKAADMLREHLGDLPAYLTGDPRGKHLPAFLIEVAGCLEAEQKSLHPELEVVSRGLEHIKHIITAQQSHAKGGVVLQLINPAELIATALDIHRESFARHQVSVQCDTGDSREVQLDKHKVLQILVNLITNAKNAVCEGRSSDRSITIGLATVMSMDARESSVLFRVQDNGMGIASENLAKIFAHGFTTRKEGHGFGLHSAANAATEMGGTIRVESEGAGRGATFILTIPIQAVESGNIGLTARAARAAA